MYIVENMRFINDNVRNFNKNFEFFKIDLLIEFAPDF